MLTCSCTIHYQLNILRVQFELTIAMLAVACFYSGELFYPGGFGYSYTDPTQSTGGMHSKLYPCGECTMQACG